MPVPALPLPTRLSILVGPGKACLAVSWSGRPIRGGLQSSVLPPCSIPVGVGLPQLSADLSPQLPAPEGSLSLTLGGLSWPVPRGQPTALWGTGTSVPALHPAGVTTIPQVTVHWCSPPQVAPQAGSVALHKALAEAWTTAHQDGVCSPLLASVSPPVRQMLTTASPFGAVR